jgi:hypothetical protein
MKKNLILLILIIISNSALAETTIPWTKEGCESVKGKWITAHSATDEGCDAAHCNGKNFCEGPTLLRSWFSALIWCQSIGRELADLETACPNGLASSRTCANLAGKLKNCAWTSSPVPSGYHYSCNSNNCSFKVCGNSIEGSNYSTRVQNNDYYGPYPLCK